MKICTGCGSFDNKPLGFNSKGKQYVACCPDNNYVDVTLSELRTHLKFVNKELDKLILLGSNDEFIVDKKRELQQQIRILKTKK